MVYEGDLGYLRTTSLRRKECPASQSPGQSRLSRGERCLAPLRVPTIVMRSRRFVSLLLSCTAPPMHPRQAKQSPPNSVLSSQTVTLCPSVRADIGHSWKNRRPLPIPCAPFCKRTRQEGRPPGILAWTERYSRCNRHLLLLTARPAAKTRGIQTWHLASTVLHFYRIAHWPDR